MSGAGDQRRRIAVIGGGISGLAAARALARAGHQVTVLEGSPVVGGKLALASVAGVTVDVGAEAMLARRPEAVGLALSAGLPLVAPSPTAARLWMADALRPMPRTLMGVPTDVRALAGSGVLSEAGLARLREEAQLPSPVEDQTVSHFIGSRLGPEVVDRLVEPLLGGVYAGHVSSLSAHATIPQVVAVLDRTTSLLDGAAAVASANTTNGPIFNGIPGGIGQLPMTLATSGEFAVRTSTTVRELRRTVSGFALVLGPTIAPEVFEVDQVVLATPAAPSARLLAQVAPAAAAELAGIEYASMAIITLAFRSADVSDPLQGSGFLVPSVLPGVESRTIKASTFSANKWEWVREAGKDGGGSEGVMLLRTSVGRHREEATLQRSDNELVDLSLADLASATSLAARPVDSHVQRWGGALPQYAVGHLERIARIRADIARVPGLAVCGAAYDGLGIPACIASAQAAVAALDTMGT